MKPSFITPHLPLLTTFLLLLLGFPLGHFSNIENSPHKHGIDILNQTCNTCALAPYPFTLNTTFCFSSLGSVPISHVTNLGGLGLVALDLALENATNTLQIITLMLDDKNTSSIVCESCLESCSELYATMVAKLEGSIGEFLGEEYEYVYMWVSLVIQGVDLCEEGFKIEGKESPLRKENYSLKQLCGIVLCIIDLICPDLGLSSV